MQANSTRTLDRLAIGLALTAALAACSSEDADRRTISRARTFVPAEEGPELHATTAERFRFRKPPERETHSLHWTTPPGWEELPTSDLRQANFRVPGDDRTLCYLTVLAGDGGGLVPNVNRWRTQMSLPEVGSAEIESLPRAPFFGTDGVLVDLEGTWTGMEGGESGEGWRLVGLLHVDEAGSRFLKMVGPKSVVERELEAFRSLTASFHVDHAGHEHGASDAPQSSTAQGLAWQAPAGWRLAEARPMRVVTFQLGEGDGTECYVTVLAGDGGGTLTNVNRWRSELGVEPLSEAEVAALGTIPTLGGKGVLVEVSGRLAGEAGAPAQDALLLGLVCNLPERAVYVKLVGAPAVVERERDAFSEFCKSLQQVE